ncbi:MAG: sigma-70 family RNA polymerase sigma factor [Bryobacterales bacterium]|nr:sigma-70 family RNA polymerase sigma factor [Bryobacterales bacterium]
MQFEHLSEDYLLKLAASDEEAIHHFTNYFGTLMLIKLRARMLPPLAIDEIRQETYLRVFAAIRKPQGIRDGRKLGSFVNSVCNHVLSEYYRQGSRYLAVDSEQLQDIAAQDDTESSMILRERQQTVHAVMGTLPERDRAILNAVFLEERDKDGVCQQFGIDRGYLRVLVHRAKAAFREKLQALPARRSQTAEDTQ